MPKIYITPNEVWKYFYDNKARLKDELDMIAESDNEELGIYVTEDSNFPCIVLESQSDSKPLYKDNTISKDDCEKVVLKYMSKIEKLSKDLDVVRETSKEVDETDVEMVEEREFELNEALMDFLKIATDCEDLEEDFSVDKDFLVPLMDEIEGICFEYGFPFYRPRLDFDENGESKVTF